MLPSRRFSRRYKRSIKPLILLLFFICINVFVFYKIDRDIKPTLFAVSNSEVRIEATEIINKAVKEELTNNVKYSDFVNIKSDNNGDISAIELNTAEMNKFGSQVALRVQGELKSMGGRGVDIPLGVITGSTLLSYYGPRMKVSVLPMGYVTYDFKSELQHAGINQTRYSIYIKIDTNLQIMIPLGKDKTDVSSTVPIAETLIVGKVPNSYYNNNSSISGSSGFIPVPVPEK